MSVWKTAFTDGLIARLSKRFSFPEIKKQSTAHPALF